MTRIEWLKSELANAHQRLKELESSQGVQFESHPSDLIDHYIRLADMLRFRVETEETQRANVA